MIESFGTNLTKHKVSAGERKILKALKKDYFIKLAEDDKLMVPNMLNTVALEVFVEHLQGPAVDALRKIVIANQKMAPYRNTPEYEKLCEFDEFSK